jgi:hypothetical protein
LSSAVSDTKLRLKKGQGLAAWRRLTLFRSPVINRPMSAVRVDTVEKSKIERHRKFRES